MPTSTPEGRRLSADLADPETRYRAIATIVRALHASGGVDYACEELGIQRSTLYRWERRYRELRSALREVGSGVFHNGPKSYFIACQSCLDDGLRVPATKVVTIPVPGQVSAREILCDKCAKVVLRHEPLATQIALAQR